MSETIKFDGLVRQFAWNALLGCVDQPLAVRCRVAQAPTESEGGPATDNTSRTRSTSLEIPCFS